MPRKFRIGHHRKNKERKRAAAKRKESEGECEVDDLVVKIPLTVFNNSPACNLQGLNCKLKASGGTPNEWTHHYHGNHLTLVKLKLRDGVPMVQHSLVISDNFSWKVYIYGIEVSPECSCYFTSSQLTTVAKIHTALCILDKLHICPGNECEKFEVLQRREVFLDPTRSFPIAHVESNLLGNPTIRHKKCYVLIDGKCSRCPACNNHRKSLHAMTSRLKQNVNKENRVCPSSHVNYIYLSDTEKYERLSRLHQTTRTTVQQVSRLKARLEEATASSGEIVDESTHNGLLTIMEDCSYDISQKFPPTSFRKLFWDQQLKAARYKTSSGMRWHPLMIKWCIYLRHLSSSGYEALRASSCVVLPSQRTLRDYTYFAQAVAGFSVEIDRQLIQASQVATCPEWQKCIVILMDEMYIREDLVFDKHSGALIGFTNLGEIDKYLKIFEQSLQSSSSPLEQPLAKTVLMLMVRGLFSGLQFPYAQFSCASTRGDQMFYIFWKTVGRLERYGFKVVALTCDGLSANRQLFRLHGPKCEKLTYKTKNPFSQDGRSLFFVSDPPHLIKTTRNCFANRNKHLWCHKPISWNEDPLEKFFGTQRQRGRVNENPNVQEFLKNTQALRVLQQCHHAIKGNCRGNDTVDNTENTPLIKRKRKLTTH